MSCKQCDYATHLVELIIFNDQQVFDNIAQIVAPLIKGDTDRKNKYQVTDELHDYMEALIDHYQEDHDCSKPLEALTLALLQGGFACCNGGDVADFFYDRASDGALDRFFSKI
jgi:hypothetical protein